MKSFGSTKTVRVRRLTLSYEVFWNYPSHMASPAVLEHLQ